jgi:hypothetical protein
MVFRKGHSLGLIAQDLAGLSPNSTLQSLREFARESTRADEMIEKLYSDRLAKWYLDPDDDEASPIRLGDAFEWYLAKARGFQEYPAHWTDLQGWVQEETGLAWGDIPATIESLSADTISSPTTIVHGDLHSMNILVDENQNVWPIDFAWSRDNWTPLVDFTMLECSLKFVSIPRRADLRSLIHIERALVTDAFPAINAGRVPYSVEIENVLRAIIANRRFALETMGITFETYQRALCMMTFTHSTHPSLNMPYVLASLQMLSAIQELP